MIKKSHVELLNTIFFSLPGSRIFTLSNLGSSIHKVIKSEAK